MSDFVQPTDEELAQWSEWLCWRDPVEVLPAEAFVSRPRQDAHERGYLHELFLGLHPVERKLLWHDSGVTPCE